MGDRWDDSLDWTAPFESRSSIGCVSHQVINGCAFSCHFILLFLAIAAAFSVQTYGQSATTGGLEGVVLDPSGAYVAGATVTLVNQQTGRSDSVTADSEGRFGLFLLPPGNYTLQASKADLQLAPRDPITISVTETISVELRLQIKTLVGTVGVSSEPFALQTDNSTVGHVVNQSAIVGLPLVTRNFTQLASLSPGIATGVYNAGELGSGGTALSQIAKSNDGIFAHGARSYQNNFELDGLSVSDVQGSGAYSGGIPLPNPDSIQEFKIQTALFDAGFGRYGGSNISVITRSGGNKVHGTLFDFFRNNVLNANDFFLIRAGQPRPVLNQSQFGFTLGGPLLKDKLFVFGSYQGTRQLNGLAAGQARIACTATIEMPPLTNDRSAAALGKLFGGMKGALGGVAVRPDGSNINPVALTLLNFRLPDGGFLVPTPQTVNPGLPFAEQGFYAVSQPCHFSEDQYSTNLDYSASQKSSLRARFFLANDNETVSFPGNGLNPSGNISGFSTPSSSGFVVFSLVHTYVINDKWLNQAQVGFVRTTSTTGHNAPFKWSDVGVAEGEMNSENELPSLSILGSVSMASAFPRGFTQNSFIASDVMSIERGAHAFQLGGSVTRLQDNASNVGLGSVLEFLSWPDFLLGLSATDNGTERFSNVYASLDDFGLLDREYRVWEGSAFAQDNYRIVPSLTLNLGLRYERLGQFADELGRNSTFDITRADPNPPPGGSLAGYTVASNFDGVAPAGVTRTDNPFGNDGLGQNTLAPRVGFAWQVSPGESRLVLRGGYGLYYSRPTGQDFLLSAVGPPFSLQRLSIGPTNANASFATPFAQPFPTPNSFPLFVPYKPGGALSISTAAPGIRPALIQQFSLNSQTELHEGWQLEIGYVGARGTHQQRLRSTNQALSASPDNPIRGATSNTVANISSRVPLLGIPADSLRYLESEGNTWYNGLEASLTRRLSNGLQLLASYTFSKTLDTDGADVNGTSAGSVLTLGDQNSADQRWGRASFDRAQRFVLSATWMLPSPTRGVENAFLGGWSLGGIATAQSGTALTIADTNSNNVFGISEDRAQLTGLCAPGRYLSGGSVESRLNNYFNKSCFTNPPIIGADGVGTAFGDSATGIVNGPGQANLDLALSKRVPFAWPHDGSSLEIRSEFYNALNHPQFANPDSNFTSPTFGVISSTSVSARVGQVALKFVF
jgi:hypothetical protein